MKRSTETTLAVLLILIAFGLSLTYLFDAANHFDGDEAVVGLMARHILAGQVPVYFYGQGYMGSLEALTAAGWFALLGPSVLALKLAPLTFYLLFLVLQYRLVRRGVGPGPALLTLAITIVFSPTIILWSTKARGGFTAVLFLGTLAYWLAFRLIDEIRAGRFRWRDGCLLGVTAGLGFWTCGMVAYYYFPIVLYFLARGTGETGDLLKAGRQIWAKSRPRRAGWSPGFRWLIGAVFSVLTVYLLFSLVILILGEIDLSLLGLHIRSHHGLRDLLRAGVLFLAALAALVWLGGVRIDYRQINRRFTEHYPHLAAGAAALIAYILFSQIVAGLFQATPEYEYGHHQTVTVVESLSQAGENLSLLVHRLLPAVTGISRVAFKFDPGKTASIQLASRINQAALLAAAVVAAFYLAGLRLTSDPRRKPDRKRRLAGSFALSLVGCCLAMVFTSQVQDTTAYRYLIPVVSWFPFFLAVLIIRVGKIWQPAGVLLLLTLLGGRIVKLVPEILQPPPTSPRSSIPEMISELRRAGANRVWANYWIAYPISFLTGEEIIAAPYRSQDRYPPYTREVEQAREVTYVFPGTCHSRPKILERVEKDGRIPIREAKYRWGYLLFTRRDGEL